MDAVEVPQVHTVEKVAPVPQLTVQDTDQLFPTQPREHHLAVLGCEFSNRRTVETVRRFENFHTMTARWCSWGWGGNKCSRQEVVRQVAVVLTQEVVRQVLVPFVLMPKARLVMRDGAKFKDQLHQAVMDGEES